MPDNVGLRVRSVSAVSQPFLGQTQNFVHFSRGTAQKRLRNGWSNGRVLVKVTASAPPRCGYQSWGISLSFKLVVVRTTSCRIAAVFTPISTLYLKGDTLYSKRINMEYHESLFTQMRMLIKFLSWKTLYICKFKIS